MTDRLPFDPAKTAAARARPAEAPLTVTKLAGRIGAALAAGFPASVRVIGQVSGFRDRTHWYFDLKDEGAVASCVMFASAAKRLRFTPQNGQEIIVSARPDYYAKGGKLALIVERVEPVGAGALELAFRALCEELKARGWFEQDRKRSLPTMPRRVAIVTSRTGAALQDVLDTMKRRMPALPLALVDVRVQGEGAAVEVAGAIRWLGRERERLGVDVILVTRGGGSMEDLWAFNERVVAEAIVSCPIPVVAAIGHETDVTIAELVADVRAATPTQAAMRLTPDREALIEQVAALSGRLRAVVRQRVRRGQEIDGLARHLRLAAQGQVRAIGHALERLAGRLDAHRPAALHANRAATVDGLRLRLAAAMQRLLSEVRLGDLSGALSRAWAVANERTALHLDSFQRQFAAIDPTSVLKRGYSYTLREDGGLVRVPTDVKPGDRLRTRLSEGEVRSVVEGSRPLRPIRSKPAADGSSQLDLFGGGR
jgi:exodeoxyribonuclease VII large subunit